MTYAFQLFTHSKKLQSATSLLRHDRAVLVRCFSSDKRSSFDKADDILKKSPHGNGMVYRCPSTPSFRAINPNLGVRSVRQMGDLVSGSMSIRSSQEYAKRGFSSASEPPSWNFLSSAKSILRQDELHRRNIHTNQADELAVEKYVTDRSNQVSSTDTSLSLANNNANDRSSSVECNVISNLKTSSKHDLAMVFTCKVCETRSVKTCCRESYERGVVFARCPGCDNMHLMADRLGWFGEPGSIEDLLASRGETVKKGLLDTLSLSPEDLAGFKY